MDLPLHRIRIQPTPAVAEGRAVTAAVTANLRPMFPPPPLAPQSLSTLSEIAAELSLLSQCWTNRSFPLLCAIRAIPVPLPMVSSMTSNLSQRPSHQNTGMTPPPLPLPPTLPALRQKPRTSMNTTWMATST